MPTYKEIAVPAKKKDMSEIYSYGGCCTTALRRALGIPNHGHLKHRRVPPKKIQEKSGYIYGDPRDSVLSFFFRHENHGKKFCHLHGLNLGVKIPGSITLQGFLDEGRDQFRLSKHFDNWVTAKINNIIFIKYETMFDHLDEISEFFGRRLKLERKKRKSDWRKQPPHVQEALTRIYRNLITRIETMPPILIK